MTQAARLAALQRQIGQLAGMDAARARTPEPTPEARAAFEALWRTKFHAWTHGYSEAEADGEARRWLALLEQAV